LTCASCAICGALHDLDGWRGRQHRNLVQLAAHLAIVATLGPLFTESFQERFSFMGSVFTNRWGLSKVL
jgi:hypothetical protein